MTAELSTGQRIPMTFGELMMVTVDKINTTKEKGRISSKKILQENCDQI